MPRHRGLLQRFLQSVQIGDDAATRRLGSDPDRRTVAAADLGTLPLPPAPSRLARIGTRPARISPEVPSSLGF
jgi:hypothetical protein